MSWDGAFATVNVIALGGWLLLAAGHRGPKTMALILYLGIGLLCFAYALMAVGLHAGWFEANRMAGAPPANFLDYSVSGLRNLFMSDGGLVLGWTHYLALDLFVGQWIARDAENKGFSRLAQLPVLLLTMMVGPIGLLTWLVIREQRARRRARGNEDRAAR